MLRRPSGRLETPHRLRLHRGGDRRANSALHLTVIRRIRTDPATRAYITKKNAHNRSKKDAIRCLKRYLAREVFNALKADLILS